MDRDKTGEVLNKINSMQKDLLGGLYGDFFGSGAATRRSTTPTRQQAPSGSRPAHPMPTQSVGGSGTGTEDPLKEAQRALDEFNARLDSAEMNGVATPKTENEAAPETQNEDENPKEPEEDPMETLDKLIGLDKIKNDVKELTNFVKVQKTRQDAGLKSVPVSLHLVFTGNPGTGKTTVARIIAKLYKQIGVLSKGQLVETDRSGLVAGYVGQTAIKTQEMIKKAMGGVLFIDEAYSLAQKDDAFGQEAIDTILKAMEDHRDDLVVIVAGYTGPMEKFINSNPGLKSRFNKYIEFSDYSIDELMQIFDMNCSKYDYVVEEETKTHIRELITQRKLQSPDNFANAREVRNLFEEIITNQATRIASVENPAPEDMMKITNEDLFDQPSEVKEAKEAAVNEETDNETVEADVNEEVENEKTETDVIEGAEELNGLEESEAVDDDKVTDDSDSAEDSENTDQ